MERYTEKHYGENGYYLICSGNCEALNCGYCGILDKIVGRLAAYEDTGLEPGEIAHILDAYGRGMTLRTENAQRLEIVKDIQTDRLRELAQADREGRCVVLPCKVGDTLYDIYEAMGNGTGEIRELKVNDIRIHLDKRSKEWLIAGGYYFSLSDFGKTVFLTRAEAQAALRREQDG